MLKKFRKPEWLVKVTSSFHYPEVERITEEQVLELKKEGWNPIAGDYKTSEYWMLENAIASLERGSIEYRLYRVNHEGIRIFRKGGVFDEDGDVEE